MFMHIRNNPLKVFVIAVISIGLCVSSRNAMSADERKHIQLPQLSDDVESGLAGLAGGAGAAVLLAGLNHAGIGMPEVAGAVLGAASVFDGIMLAKEGRFQFSSFLASALGTVIVSSIYKPEILGPYSALSRTLIGSYAGYFGLDSLGLGHLSRRSELRQKRRAANRRH